MREAWMSGTSCTGVFVSTSQSILTMWLPAYQFDTTIGPNKLNRGAPFRRKQENELTPEGKNTDRAILLVEGDSTLRRLITEVLRSNGYSVFSAEDGEQAARMFSRLHSNIVLVLTGVYLSKINGDRLLKIIRRIDPGVPVVFETGYLDQRLRFSLLRAGASGFIQRPGPPAEIITTIRNVLSGQG